jgi:hypothetical protein
MKIMERTIGSTPQCESDMVSIKDSWGISIWNGSWFIGKMWLFVCRCVCVCVGAVVIVSDYSHRPADSWPTLSSKPSYFWVSFYIFVCVCNSTVRVLVAVVALNSHGNGVNGAESSQNASWFSFEQWLLVWTAKCEYVSKRIIEMMEFCTWSECLNLIHKNKEGIFFVII